MKTTTLFQSSLLAAGLLLGGMSAAHADNAYTIITHGGDFHPHSHDYRSCRYMPGWHHDYRRDSSYHSGHHRKHAGKHQEGHHESHDRGDRHEDTGHWQQGKHDDWHDAGRHGQQSRSAGIGYTGRS